MEHVLGNKVNFSNLVIYLLSILTSCQFTNELNREISRGVFQNHGVCGQVFPFLPSPSPFHFLCSRSNFRAITHLVTLATQATSIGEVPKTEPITLSFQEIGLLPTEPPLPQLQSNPALWTPAYYRDLIDFTPGESPYTFSKFNPLNIDTH